MAQSQYYNSTDKAFVTDAQTQMNALGAGLKVDGAWGPKTEAAYSQYSGQLKLKTPTTGTGGAASTDPLSGIKIPGGMDPNDPLLGLKHIHAQNVQDIKDRGKADRQAIQNAALAKGMSSSSVPLSQMADQRGGEGKALERQGNQLAVDAVGHLQQLRRDQEARDFEREKFTWAKHMDTENLKLARQRAYNSTPKAPKSVFDNATADQNKAYNKALASLILNPKHDPKVIYTNLLTNPSPFYTENLGPELFKELLSKAEEAYRGHTPTEQEQPKLGATVSSFMDAVDKGSWVKQNFPNIPDAHVKHIEGYLKDNKDSANSTPQLISAYLTAMESEGSRFNFNTWLNTYIKSANLSNKEIDDFMRFYNSHSKIN